MKIEIVVGDITQQSVDAIVNAANNALAPGAGVSGAIHRAAGPELAEACAKLKGCETGNAKITGGYNLSAKFVIHTVGPVWNGGNKGEPQLLASCYRTCIKLAVDEGLVSIAFPAISTGVFGYPQKSAAKVALETVRESDGLDLVRFVCYDSNSAKIYEELMGVQNQNN